MCITEGGGLLICITDYCLLLLHTFIIIYYFMDFVAYLHTTQAKLAIQTSKVVAQFRCRAVSLPRSFK